jgi:hypothetical protein
MANKYNDILTLVNAGNNMGLSNTIKRDYGIPLDFTSVQESYDAAVIYAATSTLAYVGQTVAVGSKLYIISDVAAADKHVVGEAEYDNYLAEVGSKTEGDGNTIELDGQTLKLAGLTGLDNSKTYVPSLVNGKLIWAEPDTSTAEGQQAAITALETRATALEVIVNGKEASAEGADDAVKGLVEKVADEISAREAADTALEGKIAEALQAAKDYADENDANTVYDDTAIQAAVTALETTVGDDNSGLVKNVATNAQAIATNAQAVADEKTRAEAAEKALGERIDAIDFVDPDELSDAIKDFATKEYVDGEIDTLEAAIAALNHFKAEVVDSTDKVTETGVLYLIKDDSVEGVDKYNEYIVVGGVATLIGDTTTDLSNYYNKTEISGIVETINGAIADEATARGELATEVDDLAADIEKVAGDLADANGVIAGKVNSTDFETFKTENTSAIATAKQEAIEAAAEAEEAKGYAVATEVANTYVNKTDFATYDAGIQAELQLRAKSEDVNAELAKKIETGTIAHSSDSVAEGVTVNGTQLNIVVDTYTKQEVRDYVADTIETMTGGESAADVLLALNNHIKDYTEKVGQLDAKDTAHDTAITAAQTAADNAAAEVTKLANGQVNTNKTDIATLTAIITGDDANSHTNRLSTLESFKTTHTGEYNALKSRVDTNESVLATKAAAADVYTKTATDNLLAEKANVTDVYTKTEVDAKVITSGEVAHGDTESVTIADNKITVTVNAYTKGEVDTLIANIDQSALEQGIADNAAAIADNATAIAKLVGDDSNKSAREIAADEINVLIKAADPENDYIIDNIANLVKYVDDNAGDIAKLVSDVAANTTAIGTNTSDIATINAALAALVQPKASTEISVAADGTLGINEMNVNKLVQTDGDTLIIDGGTAK